MHTILVGDAREQLASLSDQSVQCCVTSPPYWNLRDYGHADQIGNEPTVDQYVENLVAVFREVRRVVRDDGVLFLNLGDTYAANRSYQVVDNKHRDVGNSGRMSIPNGLKAKDLIGVPWMVAFALRADGWYLRSEIIWSKPNCMPESVTDRPTKSHEQIFLLSKSPHYFYDGTAIAEQVSLSSVERLSQPTIGQQAGSHRVPGKTNGTMKAVGGTSTRNQRSVWTITTRGYGEAHFAVFPPEIPTRAIKAGTSERGQCRECGSPWVRVVERHGKTKRQAMYERGESAYASVNGNALNYKGGHNLPERTFVERGWEPTCECNAGEPVPQTVLDPFAGSGTTGEVAEFLGRRVVLIELNPAYVPLIEKRLAQRTIWDALAVAD